VTCSAALNFSPQCGLINTLTNNLVEATITSTENEWPRQSTFHYTEQRIYFTRLTFNVRDTATPDYLSSLISNRVAGTRMSVRSSTRSLMANLRTNTVCACRSFSVRAPVVRNSLPPDIQSCSCSQLLSLNWRNFYFVDPMTSGWWQNTSESSDYMALYELIYLLTYTHLFTHFMNWYTCNYIIWAAILDFWLQVSSGSVADCSTESFDPGNIGYRRQNIIPSWSEFLTIV
jgi:hypothetical protein